MSVVCEDSQSPSLALRSLEFIRLLHTVLLYIPAIPYKHFCTEVSY